MSDELNQYFKVTPQNIYATCTDIRVEDGNYGKRIIFEVMPLGQDTARFKGYNAENANSARSDWQKLRTQLRKLNVDVDSAEGIIGTIMKIEEIPASFTRQDGEVVEYDKWLPRKVYASEDEALEDMGNEPVGPSNDRSGEVNSPEAITEAAAVVWGLVDGNEENFRAIATKSWPNADVDALVNALKGETPTSF